MFAAHYFAPRYFPPRYFDQGGVEENGAYFAPRYFAGRYFAPSYFPSSEAPPLTGFTCAPTTVPASHAGEIEIVLTGSGTAWLDDSEVFTADIATKTRQTIRSNTDASVWVTTSATTGQLTIGETVGSDTATVTVATASVSVSPSSGRTDQNPRTLTVTVTNGVCTQESTAGLLTITGGSGVTFDTVAIVDDATISVRLVSGGGSGALTVTHVPTGQSGTYGVAAATAYTVFPYPRARAAENVVKKFFAVGNGLTTVDITGAVNQDGGFASPVALNNTSPVELDLTMTDYVNSPYTVSFTNGGSLIDPSPNVTLTVTRFASSGHSAENRRHRRS